MATTRQTTGTTDIDDAALDRMIEQDPHKPGRDNARLAEYGTPVWALIAALQGTGGNVEETAADYLIPEVAVRAAMRYYERHRDLIDAHILLNDEGFERFGDDLGTGHGM